MLKVQREIGVLTDHTPGKLFLDDTELCWTLEPGLERAQHPAIQSGTYGLTLQPYGEVFNWMAPHLENGAVNDGQKEVAESFRKNGIPLLTGVEGRAGVEIHIGNTQKDTLACLLLGIGYDDHGKLSGSTAVYFKVYPVLLNYIKNADNPQIQYLDAVTA